MGKQNEWEPYRHKVQYYETDQMGIVHHSNYIRWFEEARTDYMERMGMGYDQMEARGILSPVLSVEADYHQMVRFGETVYDQENQRICCQGITKHCFLDREGKFLSLKQACLECHQMFVQGLEDHENHEEREDKS